MDKNRSNLLVKELRVRIKNLLPVDDSFLFLKEVGRLGEWIQNGKEFDIQLLNLEVLRDQAEDEQRKSLSSLFNECMRVWADIKKHKILSKDLSPTTAKHLNQLKRMDREKVSYVLDLYYALIHFIEELALTKYKKIVAPYYIQRIQERIPQVSGKLHDYYLKLLDDKEETKRQHNDSVWGAMGMVNQIVSMCKGENHLLSLTRWAKVFKKQECLIYLNKIADYLFDYRSSQKVKETIPCEYAKIPAYELACWPRKLEMKNHNLTIGEENLSFYPEKSSSKQLAEGENTDREEVIKMLIQSGKEGISEKELFAKTGIDSRQICSTLGSLSRRLRSNFELYDVSIKKYGLRKNYKHCLFIVLHSKEKQTRRDD